MEMLSLRMIREFRGTADDGDRFTSLPFAIVHLSLPGRKEEDDLTRILRLTGNARELESTLGFKVGDFLVPHFEIGLMRDGLIPIAKLTKQQAKDCARPKYEVKRRVEGGKVRNQFRFNFTLKLDLDPRYMEKDPCEQLTLVPTSDSLGGSFQWYLLRFPVGLIAHQDAKSIYNKQLFGYGG